EQVLINLLSNAMKYGEGKSIKVKVSKNQSAGIFMVEDKGIGIEEEDSHRIFNRFERVSHKSGSVGLGLGLYISKVITEAHSGQISVKSSPGQGTLFMVE